MENGAYCEKILKKGFTFNGFNGIIRITFEILEDIPLEHDAASAGVSPGGLFNSAEIKILVCYILSNIEDAVPGQMLANVLHYEGIANCFEVNEAIASLVKSGQLTVDNPSDDTYRITQSGRDVAETLKTSLPFTVKEKGYLAALKMVSRFKNAKDTEISISKENDKTYITCSALDGGQAFMTIKLMVADEGQAVCIKERFLNDSSAIFSGIIDLLIK